MGLFDKLKDLIGTEEDEYNEDEDFFPPDRGESKGFDQPILTETKEDKKLSVVDNNKKTGKVVNIHTTAQLQVILVKPERFDDAVNIADHLLDKRTVVLNLESTNKDVSRRLVDFLSGVAYAGGGQIKKVANSTFIITPYNVNIMGDLIDELESTGVFF